MNWSLLHCSVLLDVSVPVNSLPPWIAVLRSRLSNNCKAHLLLFICVNKILHVVILYGIMASNVHNMVSPQNLLQPSFSMSVVRWMGLIRLLKN